MFRGRLLRSGGGVVHGRSCFGGCRRPALTAPPTAVLRRCTMRRRADLAAGCVAEPEWGLTLALHLDMNAARTWPGDGDARPRDVSGGVGAERPVVCRRVTLQCGDATAGPRHLVYQTCTVCLPLLRRGGMPGARCQAADVAASEFLAAPDLSECARAARPVHGLRGEEGGSSLSHVGSPHAQVECWGDRPMTWLVTGRSERG